MTDPWVMALDALFTGPGSEAAEFIPNYGDIRPIRVIRSRPDEEIGYGRGRAIIGTHVIQFRRSEVGEPIEGDRVKIGADHWKLVGEPMTDAENLTWECGVVFYDAADG